MAAGTKTRGARASARSTDEVRAALIADIVSGELFEPAAARGWRWLARRYDAPDSALRLAALDLHELGLVHVERTGVRAAEQESWRLFATPVFRELDRPEGRAVIAAFMDARRCVDPALCARAAARRRGADVTDLLLALGSLSAAAGAPREAADSVRRYRAANDRVRRAIGRTAGSRYLAAISARLRTRTRDAGWLFERARDCPEAALLLNAQVDAIRCGDAGQAAAAAHAEIDLIESWIWHTLAERGRGR